MTRLFKSKKILIPDTPPSVRTTKQGLIVVGIGAFCAGVVTAALLFVFFGA